LRRCPARAASAAEARRSREGTRHRTAKRTLSVSITPSQPTCLLHVGTPKTGTSSIQESLFHGLADPAFRYVNLGFIQGAQFLAALFLDRPEQFWFFRARGFSAKRVRQLADNYEGRLRRALRKARDRSQTPILSAELLWKFPPANLARLRDFLLSEGFKPRTLVYLRPIKSWMESRFQQRNKLARVPFFPFEDTDAPNLLALHQYAEKLDGLRDVFGPDALTVRPFVRSQLTAGCAVRDFCQTAGVTLHPDAVLRSNESLNADATQFLYAQNRFGSPKNCNLLRRLAVVRLLEGRKGPTLRFHSSVFDRVARLIEDQTTRVAQEHGIDISENLKAADAGPCVREEKDLFRFERASLDWLAETAGSPSIKATEGEDAAREVAVRMDQLCGRPLLRQRWELAQARIKTRLRWIQNGD